MNDDVSVRVLHTRMAVASWIFPLLALFALAMAGETSLFVRRVPAYSDEHRLTYDMVILSLLLTGLALSTWCLTLGRKHVPPLYVPHAKAGVFIVGLVFFLSGLSTVLDYFCGS